MDDQHKLLKQIVTITEDWGSEIIKGDSTRADKLHDDLTKLFRSMDDDLKKHLLPELCGHQNVAVKMWSATSLLKLDENFAVAVLQECIKEKNLIGIIAELILVSWQDGTFNY